LGAWFSGFYHCCWFLGCFISNFKFGGNMAVQGPFICLVQFFSLDNVFWGTTLPIIPFGVTFDKSHANRVLDWLRLVVPVCLLLPSWGRRKSGVKL
jgi:hypothetical protein